MIRGYQRVLAYYDGLARFLAVRISYSSRAPRPGDGRGERFMAFNMKTWGLLPDVMDDSFCMFVVFFCVRKIGRERERERERERVRERTEVNLRAWTTDLLEVGVEAVLRVGWVEAGLCLPPDDLVAHALLVRGHALLQLAGLITIMIIILMYKNKRIRSINYDNNDMIYV